MKIVITGDVPARAQDPAKAARPGSIIRKLLLTDHAPDGLSFRLIRSQYQDGELAFESPRHHHAFQQVRWTESGSVNYGPGQDIPEGDIAYFPQGAYYGPQRKDQGAAFLLQYGFGAEFLSGNREAGARGAEAAVGELRSRGTFEGGLYIDTDPATGGRRERDSVQAIYEARTTSEFVIPPEGYAAPVLMHTKAFSYYQASAGVEVRRLGDFYDHPGPDASLRIYTVRLTGGTWRFGPGRAQVAWTTTAGLRADGTTYPELTCIYSPRDDAAAVSGDGTEMFVLELPRLG